MSLYFVGWGKNFLGWGSAAAPAQAVTAGSSGGGSGITMRTRANLYGPTNDVAPKPTTARPETFEEEESFVAGLFG